MALLAIEDLTVAAYDKVEAVRDNLAVDRARCQIVTVIGPNGRQDDDAGCRHRPAHLARGRMSYDGTDLRQLDVEARIERGFCLVPEKRELFGDLGRRQPAARRLHQTARERRREADDG